MYQNHPRKLPASPSCVAPDHERLPLRAPRSLHPLRVGLLGFGTVGGGTYRVLRRNAQLIEDRAGCRIEISMVAVRNMQRVPDVEDTVALTGDPFKVVRHPDIDVVVEAIGGTTIARDLTLQAISNGKHVVTANKALLAVHGTEIFTAARERGVMVAYEGAVAVSIPIIKALREGLVANRINWVAGIINGTTNFILSEMKTNGLEFSQALQEAMQKGYAEQDPSFDLDGIDAAHKLTLLASNAFGIPLQFDSVYVQGIRDIEHRDVVIAERLGFAIKLLGIAQRSEAGISLRVEPALIPSENLLSHVHGSMNAVMVHSDAAGLTMYYGAGAGAEETASAVVADLVDVARGIAVMPEYRVPYLGFQESAMAQQAIVASADVHSSHYLSVDVRRGSHVVTEIAQMFCNADLRWTHREWFPHQESPDVKSLVFVTLPAPLRTVSQLAFAIEQMPGVVGPVKRMCVEQLN